MNFKPRKKYRPQEDRLLKRLSQEEKAYQLKLRSLIRKQELDYLYVR